MLNFSLGLIIGLMISLVLLAIEFVLKKNDQTMIQRAELKIQNIKDKKSIHIIPGMSPIEQTQADIIAENDTKNIDTDLETL